MVTASDGRPFAPGHQLAQLHAVHFGGRPVKYHSDVGDQIVDIAEYCLSYLLAVAAALGADGAAFVKKGVISSHSAVKSPVAIEEISVVVS